MRTRARRRRGGGGGPEAGPSPGTSPPGEGLLGPLQPLEDTPSADEPFAVNTPSANKPVEDKLVATKKPSATKSLAASKPSTNNEPSANNKPSAANEPSSANKPPTIKPVAATTPVAAAPPAAAALSSGAFFPLDKLQVPARPPYPSRPSLHLCVLIRGVSIFLVRARTLYSFRFRSSPCFVSSYI